ncbi:MAG: ankyrin repeat domain-containing protein [Lentisphaerota bacterium]
MKLDELKAAIFRNDLAMLEQLLKDGSNQEQNDANGVSLLFHAINFGSVTAVKLLLDHGADINQSNWRGRTPWLLAVESGDLEKISLLREREADTKAKNDQGQTGLHYSAMRGREYLFNELLEHSGEEVSYTDQRGNTILHLAAAWGNPAIVKTILAKTSLPVDSQNNDGETAFICAVTARQTVIAKILMDAGCDINLADKNGVYPLLAMVKSFKADYKQAEPKQSSQETPELMQLFADSNVKVQTLPEKSAASGLGLMKNMLAAGSAINTADRNGETPLQAAIRAGNMTFLPLLLASGADMNCRDKDGATPLLTAILDNNYDLAALLLGSGADTEIADKEGLPLLTIAARLKPLDIFCLLLLHKQDDSGDKSVNDAIGTIFDRAGGKKRYISEEDLRKALLAAKTPQSEKILKLLDAESPQ